ncbi:hypothetical protein TEA_003009 [Camellia sinensis var. sinensis]|uniref:Transaldolase n=1 Tax=Camellia sinensis var. sinensis TaxID=542762 RepID=A0A4S4DSE8_CAMSN|nr:hypothetical protein TEA_003009 [Camellia sinensis var. sinensis]
MCYLMDLMDLGSITELDSVSRYSEIVPDTVIFDDFERFPPTAATVSSSLLLGICSLPDTMFRSAVDTALADSECYGPAGPDVRMSCFVNKALVNVGGELAKLVPGRVSTEVDARLAYDTHGIVRKVHDLLKLYHGIDVPPERLLFKIPSTWQGIEASRVLESEGIQTHLTFVYSFGQAAAAAQAGASVIQIFVGRIRDWARNHSGDPEIEAALRRGEDPGLALVSYTPHCYVDFIIPLWLAMLHGLFEISEVPVSTRHDTTRVRVRDTAGIRLITNGYGYVLPYIEKQRNSPKYRREERGESKNLVADFSLVAGFDLTPIDPLLLISSPVLSSLDLSCSVVSRSHLLSISSSLPYCSRSLDLLFSPVLLSISSRSTISVYLFVTKAYNYIHKYGHKSKLMAAAVRNKQDIFNLLGVDYIITPLKILQSLKDSITPPDDKYSFAGRLSPQSATAYNFSDEELVKWDQYSFASAMGPAAEELLTAGLDGYVNQARRVEELFGKIWPPPNLVSLLLLRFLLLQSTVLLLSPPTYSSGNQTTVSSYTCIKWDTDVKTMVCQAYISGVHMWGPSFVSCVSFCKRFLCTWAFSTLYKKTRVAMID